MELDQREDASHDEHRDAGGGSPPHCECSPERARALCLRPGFWTASQDVEARDTILVAACAGNTPAATIELLRLIASTLDIIVDAAALDAFAPHAATTTGKMVKGSDGGRWTVYDLTEAFLCFHSPGRLATTDGGYDADILRDMSELGGEYQRYLHAAMTTTTEINAANEVLHWVLRALGYPREACLLAAPCESQHPPICVQLQVKKRKHDVARPDERRPDPGESEAIGVCSLAPTDSDTEILGSMSGKTPTVGAGTAALSKLGATPTTEIQPRQDSQVPRFAIL